MSENSFNSVLSWYLSNKSNYVFEKEPWNEKIFSQMLCFNFFKLQSDIDRQKIIFIEKGFYNTFYPEDYNKDHLQPIQKLRNHCLNLFEKQFVDDIILHGSYGTLDYKLGWSDLDVSVVVAAKVFDNQGSLVKLRKELNNISQYLYEIDPLQHHEFLISTALSQTFSKTPLMPPEVLIHGRSLINQSTLRMNKNQITSDSAKLKLSRILTLLNESSNNGYLNHHSYKSIFLDAELKNKNCMYQLKYFLSIIMTVPAYFYNAIGRPLYKGNSFDAIRSEYNFDLEILDKASLIRKCWPEKERHPYPDNKVPAWVENILAPAFFERAVKYVEQFVLEIERSGSNYRYKL